MGNINPIYSRVADIQGGGTLITATGELNCTSNANVGVFESDPLNGGFIQRLRFKSLGTNVATVARIFLVISGQYSNTSILPMAGNQTSVAAVPAAPTGTASASGGNLSSGNYFAKLQAVDLYLQPTALGAESAVVLVTGPTGSISWSYTRSANANSYILWVGSTAGNEQMTHIISTNVASYSQNVAISDVGFHTITERLTNAMFYGEVSLPATTAILTAATPDIDYVMNIPVPPNTRVLVGLGTTVAAGWVCTAIGGKY